MLKWILFGFVVVAVSQWTQTEVQAVMSDEEVQLLEGLENLLHENQEKRKLDEDPCDGDEECQACINECDNEDESCIASCVQNQEKRQFDDDPCEGDEECQYCVDECSGDMECIESCLPQQFVNPCDGDEECEDCIEACDEDDAECIVSCLQYTQRRAISLDNEEGTGAPVSKKARGWKPRWPRFPRLPRWPRLPKPRIPWPPHIPGK